MVGHVSPKKLSDMRIELKVGFEATSLSQSVRSEARRQTTEKMDNSVGAAFPARLA
jgi:hypothetical protein